MAEKKSHSELQEVKETTITKRYEIGKSLGRGNFAVVREAVRVSSGEKFAIKVIRKSKLEPDDLLKVKFEIEILLKINHPNCVRLYEAFETSKKFYLVLELLSGGELFDAVVRKGSFSEKEAAVLIRDLTLAVKFIHSMGITHRDLKPENMLFQSKQSNSPIKITDFGLAKLKPTPDALLSTACGTPGYAAPEVLRQEKYTQAVDLWSMGVTLYILLCGFPPFYHDRTAELYKLIKAAEFCFPSPYWDHISQDAKDLGNAPDKLFDAEHSLRLKLTIAKNKLRRAVQAVIICNKLAQLIREVEVEKSQQQPQS